MNCGSTDETTARTATSPVPRRPGNKMIEAAATKISAIRPFSPMTAVAAIVSVMSTPTIR